MPPDNSLQRTLDPAASLAVAKTASASSAAELKRWATLARALLTVALVGIPVIGCTDSPNASGSAATKLPAGATVTIVPVADVEWEPLNPARGDQSPKAGTLWGDRSGNVPTGFLARFADGFSSPPHIHNATYRAVVISGRIHNDDPDAAEMWMPAGSFWTQPQGEVHITAAQGATNMALVEIDRGPYLVMPPEEAFDSGERPINVDPSNIVWVDPPGTPAAGHGPKLAYLWGSPQEGQSSGTFVKLPAGFTALIHSYGATFRVVVIQGDLQYRGTETTLLEPGSYFGSKGESVHEISSVAGDESILYVRTDGRYDVTAGRE